MTIIAINEYILKFVPANLEEPYMRQLAPGSASITQSSYRNQHEKITEENIHPVDFPPREKLFQYYQKAKGCVWPYRSERLVNHHNVAIARKRFLYEFFNDCAFPYSSTASYSVFHGVKRSININRCNVFQKKIVQGDICQTELIKHLLTREHDLKSEI